MSPIKLNIITNVIVFTIQIWNDYCEAHEAYQFLRKKHTTKYGEFVPSPTYSKVSYWLLTPECFMIVIFHNGKVDQFRNIHYGRPGRFVATFMQNNDPNLQVLVEFLNSWWSDWHYIAYSCYWLLMLGPIHV